MSSTMRPILGSVLVAGGGGGVEEEASATAAVARRLELEAEETVSLG